MKQMKKGFTLVELIIVMVILGALAAIAIPKMGGSTDGAVLASIKSDIRLGIATANNEYSKALTYVTPTVQPTGSTGNTITITGSGAEMTVAVARTGAACSNSTLSYSTATGAYTSDSDGGTAGLASLTCN